MIAAAIGLLVLVPYWLAASHAGEVNPGFNVVIHALGSIGVWMLLLVPSLEQWVNGHVITGR